MMTTFGKAPLFNFATKAALKRSNEKIELAILDWSQVNCGIFVTRKNGKGRKAMATTLNFIFFMGEKCMYLSVLMIFLVEV